MNKYIISFLLLAVCLFSACREDLYESGPAQAEPISLSVSDAGFAASDGNLSRSTDTDGTTTFERTDTVGLIILDATGRLLADNVPYAYDGSNWNFCAGNTEGKQRVYFDKEMTKYIVYYPYTRQADGSKSEAAVLAREALQWREDQSTKKAFRHADVMMWTHEDGPIKEIEADMKHVRNSLSLDLKVRYILTLKNENGDPVVINYHPKRLNGNTITSYFEDFTLYMGSKKISGKTYNAQETNSLESIHKEDGAYRYILPDSCDSTFRWRYYYKGKTYSGGFQASSADTLTRYKYEKLIDLGMLSGKNILPGDYYCSKKVNNKLTGYVLPQDALELLHENTCIGIVFSVGQHESDKSSYGEQIYVGTDTEESRQCHGYAVALTNVSAEPIFWCEQDYQYLPLGLSNNEKLWNGYENCRTAKSNGNYKNKPTGFPAIYLCGEYGESIFRPLQAPQNSSGWYLPSCAQGEAIAKNYSSYLEASFKSIVEINKIYDFYNIDSQQLIGFAANNSSRYWSSTEGNTTQDKKCMSAYCYYGIIGCQTYSKWSSNSQSAARPILSF